MEVHENERLENIWCNELLQKYIRVFEWIKMNLMKDSKHKQYDNKIWTEEEIWSLHGIVAGILAYAEIMER
jgi:hypothetical protein